MPGFSHLDNGQSCEDSHSVLVLPNGWLIAIAADGAGSAKHGGEGARLVCQILIEHLRAGWGRRHPAFLARISKRGVESKILAGIEKARKFIIKTAPDIGASIDDFHATVIGCVVNESGGYFFHIGDGAGCAMNPTDDDDFVVSRPENGPYAETTFFFTEERWKKHLRITEIGKQHTIVTLMSDGVMPLALTSDMRPFSPFLAPVSSFLSSVNREDGEAALTATLDNHAVREITHDDKTFVWASRFSS